MTLSYDQLPGLFYEALGGKKWVPYDGYYPLREEGWLMEDPKPEPDDDAPEPANDPVDEPAPKPSENDDDTEEPKP